MNTLKGKRPVIDPGVCRCCQTAKKCRLLNAEYEGSGRKEVYSDMFVDCFGLVLSHLDDNPYDRLICATCVTRLRDAFNFREQVLECEQKFLQSKILFDEGNKNIKVKNEMNTEFVQEEPEYLNEETDMTDYDDNNDMELLQNDTDEKPESIDSEESLNMIMKSKLEELKSNLKSHKNITLKRKHIDTKENKTQQQNIKDKQKPPNTIINQKLNLQNDESVQNIITIVENSYVCPFNSFFNNYYCFYCNQKFLDCTKLREHSLTHDPTDYKKVLKNTVRSANRKLQIDLYRIDCRLYSENIDNVDTFKDHIAKIHGTNIYRTNEDFLKFRLTPANFKCTECDRTFSYFHTLKKHMAEHFGACICHVCGMHYFEERMLVAHMKSHQESKAKFRCKHCGKCFKSKYNMRIHIARLHTKEAPYLCAKCDEKFFSDTVRQKHMIDAHGEDSSFKCTHCDKVYINKKTLRDHCRRIHLKVHKHQCSLCDKRFYLPRELKDHMASHTGERNFKCDHCGKSYTRLWALKVHMQAHASEKKFKCTMCSASYSQNVCLKNHIKRHHQRLEPEESFPG